MTLQARSQQPLPPPPSAGLCPLSPRELLILQGVAQGETNEEMAARLRTSRQTVKNHLVQVLEKLAAPNRTAALVIALQQRWIRLSAIRVQRRENQSPPLAS